MNGSFWQWMFVYVPTYMIVSAFFPDLGSFWLEWLICTILSFPAALFIDNRVTKWRQKRAAARAAKKVRTLVEM